MTRLRRDHGAVLPLVLIILPVILVMTAIGVDLGRQRALRRTMQARSDVIALDLVRLADGRTEAAIKPQADSEKIASANRNNITPSKVSYEYGTWTQASGFIPTTDLGVPNAVKVTSTDAISYIFKGGDGHATRSATALLGNQRSASFSIGSRFASLDTRTPSVLNGVLDKLLGAGNPPLNISAIGYDGLAAANINLGTLATKLGFGTPEAMLAADPIKLKDVLTASATALAPGTPAQIALNEIVLNTNPNYEINLGDMINIADGGQDAAANAKLNVLDLVMGTAQLANKSSFITVPGLTLGIPGLTQSDLRIDIIEAPQIAIGPDKIGPDGLWVTRASTAQVKVSLTTHITVAPPPVCILFVCTPPAATVDLALPIVVGAARGEGALTKITCGAVPTAGILDIGVHTTGATATAAAVLHATLLGIPVSLPPIINADTVISSGGPNALVFTLPPTPSASQTTAANGLGLGTALIGDLNLLGIPLGPVMNLLTPVTQQIDKIILDPLFKMLGLSIAGADVKALGIDCATASAKLVG